MLNLIFQKKHNTISIYHWITLCMAFVIWTQGQAYAKSGTQRQASFTVLDAEGNISSMANNITCIKTSSFFINWESSNKLNWHTRYRLLPIEKKWSNWKKCNAVAYFNLEEKKYLFQVEDKHGTQSEIVIKVDLPLWKTSWFKLLSTILISLLIACIIYLLFRRQIRKVTNGIEDELRRTFRLKQKTTTEKEGVVAETVRAQARIRSRKYQKVTVLFADIQGFTKIVEHLNPETLIDQLDRFFFHFDEVVEKYSIEKIKTIGDAYMCAGGIPNINRTNPIDVVLAGLEMLHFMRSSRLEFKSGYEFWDLRVGIHTGPVISGEIGRKNVAFDIWGDTVNIASRMESSGTAGMINITGVTYELIKDFFECEYRGKMPVKYKGETDMYFVKRIKKELAEDSHGIYPNKQFMVRLQHVRFGDIEELVLGKLENELPANMSYHNVIHTQDVLTQIEVIARGEKVSDEDLLILKTAALLHDAGFLIEYGKHEDNSIRYAEEILPKYNYDDYQIQQIIELINVTRANLEPKNFLEKILKDADLDYLGRPDFIEVSDRLYKELNLYKKKMSLQEWNQMQYDFINKHSYYTKTARNLRQVNKDRQLRKLKELIVF